VIRKIGIPHKILVAIEKLQAKNVAQVKIANRTPTGFKTTKGLKHKCGLSPTYSRII
jgi:hypothetical protein